MSKTYFVTRHSGARDWAKRRGIAAIAIDHLDTSAIERGDVVIGTLPIHLVARINALGARYLHLTMDMKVEDRARDLSADEMDSRDARIEEYQVKAISR